MWFRSALCDQAIRKALLYQLRDNIKLPQIMFLLQLQAKLKHLLAVNLAEPPQQSACAESLGCHCLGGHAVKSISGRIWC